MANGNNPCFFGDDEGDGVGFLTEAEGGAVAEAEVAVEVLALGDGEDAGGGEDAIIAEDEAAVVERGFWLEDGDDELRGELAVDGDAGFREGADIDLALDGDEGAELAVGEIENHVRDDLDGLAVLGDGAEEVMGAECGEGAAELWLEDDDEGDGEEGGDALDEPEDDDEAEKAGDEEEGEKGKGETAEDLCATGAAEVKVAVVDDQPEDADLDGRWTQSLFLRRRQG